MSELPLMTELGPMLPILAEDSQDRRVKFEANSPFPAVMGNELEASVVFARHTKKVLGNDDDAESSIEYSTPSSDELLMPPDIKIFRGFTDNGFRVYHSAEKIEIATPECASLDDIILSMRVSELMLLRGIHHHMRTASPRNRPVSISVYKRVADANGNTWGCHDNYSYPNRGNEKFLPYYLATRSMAVGSGRFDKDGSYNFAQKIDNTRHVVNYGFLGRMYRHNADHGPRLEVGCSDANVSDWAARMRIGGVVLLKALEYHGITKQLKNFTEKYFDVNNDIHAASLLPFARQINHVFAEGDSFELSREQWHAIDFQKIIAELVMDSLVKETDIPEEYQAVASETYNFYEDLKSVVEGEKPLIELADRADWAAKLVIVDHSLKRDAESGTPRKFGDFKSRMDDMHYDVTKIVSTEKGFRTVLGSGIGWRANGRFRLTPRMEDIESAYVTPPNTRASSRAAILRSGINVSEVDWHKVIVEHENRKIVINLNNPGCPGVPN